MHPSHICYILWQRLFGASFGYVLKELYCTSFGTNRPGKFICISKENMCYMQLYVVYVKYVQYFNIFYMGYCMQYTCNNKQKSKHQLMRPSPKVWRMSPASPIETVFKVQYTNVSAIDHSICLAFHFRFIACRGYS